MCTPTQIQLNTVEMMEIELESDVPSQAAPSPWPPYATLGGGIEMAQLASNHQNVSPFAIQSVSPSHRKFTSSGVVWSAVPLSAGYGWSLTANKGERDGTAVGRPIGYEPRPARHVGAGGMGG